MTAPARDRREAYLRALLPVLVLVTLLLPLAPGRSGAAFALLVYGSTSFPADFPREALAYVRLVHAVLGAVMAGWFATLVVLLRRTGLTEDLRRALLAGLAVWALPDTGYSLASGYWQNAVLNLVVLALLLPPLLRPAAR